MNKFEFHFTCLDGHYDFTININNGVYAIITDMPNFESKDGIFDGFIQFTELINESKPQTWSINEDNTIEDSTHTLIKYAFNNKVYECSYYESHEPYGYESIIKALGLLEPNASFFIV